MNDAIVVEGLSKRFGEVQAVSNLSFSVHRGELFGFLGPNGVGKTTTINMLTGLARPDPGTIQIGGIDCIDKPRAAQHLIGVVPDESNLYPELTGLENLCFCAALYGLGKAERQDRAKKLLDNFGLAQASNRKFGGYSKEMKRKLTIAAAIMHQPEILFLDEPTTGIDVASARQLRQLIDDIRWFVFWKIRVARLSRLEGYVHLLRTSSYRLLALKRMLCAKRRKKLEAANEALDRLLEHSCQRHADCGPN